MKKIMTLCTTFLFLGAVSCMKQAEEATTESLPPVEQPAEMEAMPSHEGMEGMEETAPPTEESTAEESGAQGEAAE